MNFKYRKAAIAGTFDRLHKGHKYFIEKALDLAPNILIGLTADEFANEKRSHITGKINLKINNYEERYRELMTFLREKDVQDRVEIVKINDVYGPTLTDIDIDILAVTSETLAGGREVNRKRKENKLADLAIITIPLINSEDNSRISSTRIRLGEIDRAGRVYRKAKMLGGKISEKLRGELKNPLGVLISGNKDEIERGVKKIIKNNNPVIIVSVGDEATGYLNDLGIYPGISVVDFYIKRIRVHESLEDLHFRPEFYKSDYKNKIARIKNPSGHILMEVAEALEDAYKSFIIDGATRVIKVEGEEDLAGVPAILLAPLGSLVFYGQPGYQSVSGKQTEGIVAVLISEEKKKEIYNLKG